MSAGSRGRRAERDLRRALRARDSGVASGAGPAPASYLPPRNPGAHGVLGLFGEVLLTGVLVTAVALPVVTLPVALAAGARHLRRHIAAEESGLGLFWRDVLRGLRWGWVLGLGAVVLALVLLLDIDLAASGALPGGELIGVVGWLGLGALGAALLLIAGAWSPEIGWRATVRRVPARAAADPAGAVYLFIAAAFVAIATWTLIPLLVPALGVAALAVVAVPERAARRRRLAEVDR